MESPNLLIICLNAFLAVILLLSTLAGGMSILMWLFPGTKPTPDTATTAAIATAVATLLPGHSVTCIESVK